MLRNSSPPRGSYESDIFIRRLRKRRFQKKSSNLSDPATGARRRRPDGHLLEFLRRPAKVLCTFPGPHCFLQIWASPRCDNDVLPLTYFGNIAMRPRVEEQVMLFNTWCFRRFPCGKSSHHPGSDEPVGGARGAIMVMKHGFLQSIFL